MYNIQIYFLNTVKKGNQCIVEQYYESSLTFQPSYTYDFLSQDLTHKEYNLNFHLEEVQMQSNIFLFFFYCSSTHGIP